MQIYKKNLKVQNFQPIIFVLLIRLIGTYKILTKHYLLKLEKRFMLMASKSLVRVTAIPVVPGRIKEPRWWMVSRT